MHIDAHQHFWRYRPADYPWIEPGMADLRCDWLPSDLAPLLAQHGIDASIAVQARGAEAETDFLLDLGDRAPFVAAVIGWVDLRSPDLDRALARWQDRPKLAGFRHQVQDEADAAAFLRDPDFLRGVARLQRAQLVYEVLVFAHQLEPAAAFCAERDDHWLVLDHLGKPAIRHRAYDAWHRLARPLGAMPHVLCKLSGLVTEATDAGGQIDEAEIRRFLDGALEIFGPSRLMFGSDWPVCLLAASYERVHRIVAEWAARLSASEQMDIFGGTAMRCYEIAPAVAPAAGD